MKVFLLANCRKPELWPATEMVFKSIRVGFPTAEIEVTSSSNRYQREILKLCDSVDAQITFANGEHPYWVTSNLANRIQFDEPFCLCDTDITFWDNMEHAVFGGSPLAGRYVPQFRCEFTKCLTAPRLHTSLLFVNPPRLRAAIAEYLERFPKTVYTPSIDLFSPCIVPDPFVDNKGRFYDGAAMLYAAVGGYSFTERELECYDHLQCGCISDLVGPHVGDGMMQVRHRMIFENPQLLKGQWRRDEEFFKSRAA